MKCVLGALYGASFCAAFALSNGARAQTPQGAPQASASAVNSTDSDARPGAEPQTGTSEQSTTAPITPAPITPAADTRTQDTAAASNERAAQAAYDAARILYTNNDISGALASMGEAYRLSQRPQLLYNLGLLEAKLEHCEEALKDYTQYLQLVPQGLHRDEAEQASTQLKRDCPVDDTPSATPTPSIPSQSAPPAADSHSARPSPEPKHGYWTPARIFGWPAVTTGVLAGGAAVYFTLAAVSARNAYRQSAEQQGYGGPPRDLNLQTEQHHDQVAAQVLAVSGSALFVSGVLALFLGPRDQDSAEQVSLLIQANGVAARYKQRF